MNKFIRIISVLGSLLSCGINYILNKCIDIYIFNDNNNNNNNNTIQQLTINRLSNWDDFIINCCESLKTVNIFYIKAIQAASADKQKFSKPVRDYMDVFSDNVPYNVDEFNIIDIRNELHKQDIIIANIPIASGTVATVFKGYQASTNKTFAIKIKRNNIDGKIIQSVTDMRTIIWLINRLPYIRHLNLLTTFDENIIYIYEQLDFVNEWNNINNMYTSNIRNPNYIIPQAYYKDITDHNKNIIIMDWIDGMKLNEIPNHSKNKFCELIAKFGIKSIFFDGCVHGDLHQGNCRFILEPNEDGSDIAKIAIYDFGIICKIDRIEQDIIYRVCKNAIKGNYKLAAKILLDEITKPDKLRESLSTKQYNHVHDQLINWAYKTVGVKKIIAPIDVQELSSILWQYKLKTTDWFCKIILSFAVHESMVKSLSINKTFLEYASDMVNEAEYLLD